MTDPASRPPVTLDPALAELREHYEAGKRVIFAGAGMSAATGHAERGMNLGASPCVADGAR